MALYPHEQHMDATAWWHPIGMVEFFMLPSGSGMSYGAGRQRRVVSHGLGIDAIGRGVVS